MNEIRITQGARRVNTWMAAQNVSARRKGGIGMHRKDQGHIVVGLSETAKRPEVFVHYRSEVLATVCGQDDALVVLCRRQDSFEPGRAGRISGHTQKRVDARVSCQEDVLVRNAFL